VATVLGATQPHFFLNHNFIVAYQIDHMLGWLLSGGFIAVSNQRRIFYTIKEISGKVTQGLPPNWSREQCMIPWKSIAKWIQFSNGIKKCVIVG